MNEDHHNPTSPHWTDRVTVRFGDKWYVYRLDDPEEFEVEPIADDALCFHLFQSGAA